MFLMRPVFKVFALAVLILMICSACSGNVSLQDSPEDEAEQTHSTIYTLSDLEIIKKSADFLKSHGEKVYFEESMITVLHADEKTPICIGPDEKEVFYQGDYMEVRLYPDPDNGDDPDCTIVYLSDKGNVLGYEKK